MQRLLLTILATSVLSFAMLSFVGTADAVSTRHFTLDGSTELAQGELEGVMVHSDGHVTLGVGHERIELEGASVASAIARAGDITYVGTGTEGKIYRVQGNDSRVFAETGQLMVASLVVANDTLYAGTMPEGRVFAISTTDGAVRELARLPEAEHVWSLALDGNGRRLFAGTGPQGKVFAIDVSNGNVEVWFESNQGHVLALAQSSEGLLAGTDGDALVFRIEAAGRAEVIHDFPGNEVTALAARDGVIAVVANEMPAPRSTPGSSKAPAPGPRAGKGRLFRVDADRRVDRLLSTDSEHYTAVAIDAEGMIFVGSGKEGRIERVAPDRTHAMWIDVDERQVLAMDVDGPRPVFSTGDTGAVYRVRSAPDTGMWISKVLDSGVRARFGRLSWRGEGPLVFSTRSGGSEEPDDTWSAWSAPMRTPGPVRSAAARFVQIRAELVASSALNAVDLYYLPQNQRAAVRAVGIKPSKNKNADPIPSPSTTVELTWHVRNPDGDSLRYRVRYRREDQEVWRPMFTDEVVHTSNEYSWDTSGLPDGFYVVEVTASDELSNPGDLELDDQRTSEPLLVDNHAPVWTGVGVTGNTLRGTATDAIGPIARLEYRIDGRPWRPMFPEDDLLDEAAERVALELPAADETSHIVGVRATDSRGNTAVSEATQPAARSSR